MLTPAELLVVLFVLTFIAVMVVLLHIWFPMDHD